MVSSFSCHRDRQTAIDRGLDGFKFFGFALGSLYAFGEHQPGPTDLWKQFEALQDAEPEQIDITRALSGSKGGIGTPDDLRAHLRKFEACGVDQVTFIQQAGRNRHDHICESLEVFGTEVMPEFKEREDERERSQDGGTRSLYRSGHGAKESHGVTRGRGDPDLPIARPQDQRGVEVGSLDLRRPMLTENAEPEL